MTMEETEIISGKESGVESLVSTARDEQREEVADPGANPDIPSDDEVPSEKDAEAPEEGKSETGHTRVEVLLAEAEQRGYLRGRNEKISELMREPGMLERNDTARADTGYAENVQILQRERISIWDL